MYWMVWFGPAKDNETNDISKMVNMDRCRVWSDNWLFSYKHACGLSHVLERAQLKPSPPFDSYMPEEIMVAIPFFLLKEKPECTELELHYCKTTTKTRTGREDEGELDHGLFQQECKQLEEVKLDIREVVENWPKIGYMINGPKAVIARGSCDEVLVPVPVMGMEKTPDDLMDEFEVEISPWAAFADRYEEDLRIEVKKDPKRRKEWRQAWSNHISSRFGRCNKIYP